MSGTYSVTAGGLGSISSACGPWSGTTVTAATLPPTSAALHGLAGQSSVSVGTYSVGLNSYPPPLDLGAMNKKIENIEKMLGIIFTSSDHEDRWKELKELGDKYRALYEEIVEKERVWELLQK